jgi:hypothetical protein
MVNLTPMPATGLQLKLQTTPYIGQWEKNISFFFIFIRTIMSQGYNQAMPSLNFSDFKVFTISMVTVIGPTPPGTGVM